MRMAGSTASRAWLTSRWGAVHRRQLPGGGSPGHSHAAQVGPTLRSQSYAPYAFLVWPGPQSAAAKAAMTGLLDRGRPNGIGRLGQGRCDLAAAIPCPFLRRGCSGHVVEASMGDEAGNSDYNLGDDGVVVTDAHGRIVQ